MSDALVLPRFAPAAPPAPRFKRALGFWRARAARLCAHSAVARGPAMRALSAAEFEARRRAVRVRLRGEGLRGEALAEALALAAEASRRALGVSPYPTQFLAAAAMARGDVVEMDTGEGKTLAGFLAAAAFALSGRRVHVVTANDYLAGRDHAELEAAFAALRLSSGAVAQATPTEARRAVYAGDVVFVAGKEVVFDTLRDRLARGEAAPSALRAQIESSLGGEARAGLLIPAHDVAVIDEIDSVLIDEAGTPFLISGADGEAADSEAPRAALWIAAALRPGRDYAFANSLLPELTEAGRAEVERMAAPLGGGWRKRAQREAWAAAALAATLRLTRDRDYLVADGKVVIVDPHGGRPMPDRQWGDDLHAMVEAKEGLAPTPARRALASISYQRFFRRYRTLSGASGTVREVAKELGAIYGLAMTRAPRRLPARLTYGGRWRLTDRAALWREVAAQAAQCQGAGRPALIGVRSVAESEAAARALEGRGVAFRLLSAAQDREEAEIIAEAGQRGRVTIVTNMAGRGADIRLGEGVAALGGLVVFLCERNPSRRVDRQLMGRAARQGDPGEAREFVTPDDALVRNAGGYAARLFAAPGLGPLFAGPLLRAMQYRLEGEEARRRAALMKRDEQMERRLAFVGGLS